MQHMLPTYQLPTYTRGVVLVHSKRLLFLKVHDRFSKFDPSFRRGSGDTHRNAGKVISRFHFETNVIKRECYRDLDDVMSNTKKPALHVDLASAAAAAVRA